MVMWTTSSLKAALLGGIKWELLPYEAFPARIELDENWVGFMEELFNGHTGETAKVLKTNRDRTQILVLEDTILGEAHHVSVNTEKVTRRKEVVLGIPHTHPYEVIFSSEDILHLLQSPACYLAAIATPQHYYFAFRTKQTPNFRYGSSFVRGYLMGMAKIHNLRTSGLEPDNRPGFCITEQLLYILSIPLYKGRRKQGELVRVGVG